MKYHFGDTDADNPAATGDREQPAPFGMTTGVAGLAATRPSFRFRAGRGTKRLFGITGRAGHVMLFLFAGLLLASAAHAAAPPNVVVILVDDLGYKDVGFNGGTEIQTPNIDALAKQGTVFDAGYVTSAVCAPSRAALITGRYQQRFGLENNPPPKINQGLPLTEQTIADVLHGADPVAYATGFIGKWHLGGGAIYHPERRGFDYAYGFYPDASLYGPKVTLFRNSKPVTETRYLTTAFGEDAASFIDDNKDTPFFLYLAFNAPHTPLQAPKAYLDKYKSIPDKTRRTYAAMVSALDDAVGDVASALSRNNLDKNTLVFFLSDNGGQIAHGADNDPLRGRKGYLYEGGIRVPFFALWPGKIAAGKHYTRPASALDILPTILAATGAKPPALPLDGIDLLPYLTSNKTPPQRTLFWRQDGGTSNEQFATRIGTRKLLSVCGTETIYSLTDDSGEKTDISTPTLLAKMESYYSKWAKQMVDPLWPSSYDSCPN